MHGRQGTRGQAPRAGARIGHRAPAAARCRSGAVPMRAGHDDESPQQTNRSRPTSTRSAITLLPSPVRPVATLPLAPGGSQPAARRPRRGRPASRPAAGVVAEPEVVLGSGAHPGACAEPLECIPHECCRYPHSGRRGLAAELVRGARRRTAVQMAGGWRSPQMVRPLRLGRRRRGRRRGETIRRRRPLRSWAAARERKSRYPT